MNGEIAITVIATGFPNQDVIDDDDAPISNSRNPTVADAIRQANRENDYGNEEENVEEEEEELSSQPPPKVGTYH
jgi:hypothetical protein